MTLHRALRTRPACCYPGLRQKREISMRYGSNDPTYVFGTRDKLLRAATCALLVGGGLAGMTQASAQSAPTSGQANVLANSPIQPSSPSLQAGPLNISFGGFTALETVWRSKNETAAIGSNCNTGRPYAYSSNAYLDEFRESGRQSRFAMLVQGPEGGGWSAQSYLESDFLSGGVTSNSSESNSYTLRMRHFYGVLRNT